MYFKGNKKSVIRYISTLIITAIILAIIQIILTNSGDELKKADGLENYYININTKDGKVLKDSEINKIKAIPEVKDIIPKKLVEVGFNAFISSPSIEVSYMSNSDIEKFLQALNIKYDKEKLKNLEENQTLTSYRKEKNKNLIKGDKLADEMDLLYFDSIDTNFLLGVTPKTFPYGSDEYIIIPKDGQSKVMKEKVVEIIKERCSYNSRGGITKLAIEVEEGTFNAVKLLITITCAITTGVTTYIHYYNRRKEIGVLKALGYSDKKIIFRITKEILMSTIIALATALVIINGIVYFLNMFVAAPKGYLRFMFNISMLSDMVVVVISIMIFSLVPTWVLLKGVDKISLVEGR